MIVHELIWKDRPEELKRCLQEKSKDSMGDYKTLKEYQEARQNLPVNRMFRGQTPLTLAVQLGRKECVQILLEFDADTTTPTALGFYALQEAISYGDREMTGWIMRKRYEQIQAMIKKRTPYLEQNLRELVPDMYVEVEWRFHSWVPFLTGFCPKDTCRIWKRGNWVRLDTTLVGFEKLQWQRGDMTFFFFLGDVIKVWIVDHGRKLVEHIRTLQKEYTEAELEGDLNVSMRMELLIGKLRRISAEGERLKFLPVKSGWFGSGEDLLGCVDGYESRVYEVKNLTYVSKTRKEHLSERSQMNDSTLDVQLDLDDEENQKQEADTESEGILKKIKDMRKKCAESLPPPPLSKTTFEEYFTRQGDEYVHLGRKLQMKEKRKTIGGRIWMARGYPLSVEQLMPLLELIAPSNKHFDKLRDFVDTELPPGFPIKLDVPIFYVLSAEVSFCNIHISSSTASESEWKMVPKTVISDDNIFKVPGKEDGYSQGIVIPNIFKDE